MSARPVFVFMKFGSWGPLSGCGIAEFPLLGICGPGVAARSQTVPRLSGLACLREVSVRCRIEWESKAYYMYRRRSGYR